MYALSAYSPGEYSPPEFVEVPKGSMPPARTPSAISGGHRYPGSEQLAFLLALYVGILLVVIAGEFDPGSVNAAELGPIKASTV